MRKIKLCVNGLWRQFVIPADRVLLDILRQDLHLTGAKQSCDRKGQCGACTVLVNGKATRSCLSKAVDLDGAEVITVEGLGTPQNPHLIQEAFVLSGAIQCGYCTPAMIMAAKALLDENPNPSVPEIKNALRRISIAAAIFCAALCIAVFALLLLVQHDSLAEAARGAAPLALFALFGAFGAIMTRYLAG